MSVDDKNYSGFVRSSPDDILSMPMPTYIIHVARNFEVRCTDKPPSSFQCWMLKLCFGWKVEIIDAS